jgi:membrane protease YdiL (CAAX protease family)
MATHRTTDTRDRHMLRQFFTLVFLLGWGTGIFMVLFMDPIEKMFGEIGYTNPVFILLVWSPAISSFWLVWRSYGTEGLRSFLRRLTLGRMPVIWWAILIAGIPAVYYAAAALNGSLDDGFPFSPWYKVFPALLAALMIGPMEEFGWRGVALPLLQRRHSPFRASIVLGAVWGVWHAPSFLMSGTPQSGWDFGPFFIGVIAISLIITPMFNAAGGSLLVSVLYHFQLNGPIWPDAQPWDNYLFAVVAIGMVLLFRTSMFRTGAGETNVLMPGEEERIGTMSGAGRVGDRPAGTPHPA